MMLATMFFKISLNKDLARMDQAALQEQKKYDILWSEIPAYRDFSPAEQLAPIFLQVFKDQLKAGETVTDFGCGTGRSATSLLAEGLHVHLVDFCGGCLDPKIFLFTLGSEPTINFFQECLWDLSDSVAPSEWIICFDVLEHLPEERIDDVLKAMSSRMQKGGLVSISLCEDGFGASIGETLHLTVKSASWWHERMSRYFSIVHEFEGDGNILVLVLSRK